MAVMVQLKPIEEIAGELGIPRGSLIPYGRSMAKVHANLLKGLEKKEDGSLILVTSMSSTPAGEGKTTLTIGLAQSMRHIGKKAAACLRQPSIGPFLGAKGGATGSGLSRVEPVEEISLQFTGDDYSVALAHNFIASIMDNHIYHGNSLGIDAKKIFWRRVSSVNDRALRHVRVEAGSPFERGEEFHISAASEVMSILCLSKSFGELKARLGSILLALDAKGRPVTLKDMGADGAAAALLRNALHPNLVQTVEGAPAFIHGGPFGNISLGCNSLIATSLALKLTDFVLTEAGFSTELGAEKFFDIKCRTGGLRPSAAVIVASLRSLRFHGGAKDYNQKDMGAAKQGLDNLKKHIENVKRFSVPAAVAINRFHDDTDPEIREVIKSIEGLGVPAFAVNVRDEGGSGGVELAEWLAKSRVNNGFRFLYPEGLRVKEKISVIAKEMYGAEGVNFTPGAEKDINDIERLGYGGLPVCVAKTPKSLSDNAALPGRPNGFKITVDGVVPNGGAGFLVARCGHILLMPGLPAHPLAEKIDISPDGAITGIS